MSRLLFSPEAPTLLSQALQLVLLLKANREMAELGWQHNVDSSSPTIGNANGDDGWGEMKMEI